MPCQFSLCFLCSWCRHKCQLWGRRECQPIAARHSRVLCWGQTFTAAGRSQQSQTGPLWFIASLNPTPRPYTVACAGPSQEAYFHPKLKIVKPQKKVYVFLTVLLPYHQASRNISVTGKRAHTAGCWHRKGYTEEEKLSNSGAGHWKLLWKGSHRAMALPGPKCALLWELMIPPSSHCPATFSYPCFWSHSSGGSKVGWVRKHVWEKNNHLSHSVKG